MNILKNTAKFVTRYMAAIVIAVTVFAYLVDNSFTSWVANPGFLNGFINTSHLLMLIMFGMGLTLKFSDFKVVFSQPGDILTGEAAQYLIMPLAGLVLCRLFNLPAELAVGVILVGCCPGGTSSNVMTFMAGGDVALSVGMTAVSTILAPFMTPLLCTACVKLYTGMGAEQAVQVDAMGMFVQIIQIVILPIALGLIVNRFFSNITQKIGEILPLISCIGICLIVGYVIDANSAKLFANGFVIIFVVILHNIIGYLLGFLIGTVFKMPPAKRNAISIEVGMQNSGMASTLAASCFPSLALATVPGAIFSAWHNISGAIAANMMANRMGQAASKEKPDRSVAKRGR